jgi:hypothetical protein
LAINPLIKQRFKPQVSKVFNARSIRIDIYCVDVVERERLFVAAFYTAYPGSPLARTRLIQRQGAENEAHSASESLSLTSHNRSASYEAPSGSELLACSGNDTTVPYNCVGQTPKL